MTNLIIGSIELTKVSKHNRESCQDLVIHEAEVAIELNGKPYRQFYCLPICLEELVLGHLKCEGIGEPSSLKVAQNKVIVHVSKEFEYAASNKLSSQVNITKDDVLDYIQKLEQNSILFKKTGGTHTAGILGELNAVFIEDISRHCAMDKVVGLAIKSKMDPSQSVLVASWRQTFSIMSKAIRAQIPIVISLAAPTSLAIEYARKFGITLIGFAREDRFNIYSHEWRILGV